ncbi:MAG: TAT-variant-translocated molybdopterin oxidoreductase [Caldilineaceae bacterium]
MHTSPLDLSAIQERLSAAKGRGFWRSLEELAETDEFTDFLHREFPRQASEWLPDMSRRRFLQLMGASLALSGLTACNGPAEKIVPYVNAPEGSTAGQSLFFATAMPLGGYGLGLLAQSQMGRPTKLEGNPDHPASLGGTDAIAQASILTLYDPDRAQDVTNGGAASSWDDFVAALQSQFAQLDGGAGLHILTESTSSPTCISQMEALQAAAPNAVWHQYEPLNRDSVYAGSQLAFGQPLEPVYHFDKANVIVSLDADFLQSMPGSVRYARDFAGGRGEAGADARPRNRLYAIESSPTLTGAAADHRLPLKASQVEMFARALANALGVAVDAGDASAIPANWISAVADDLRAAGGAGLVLAGDQQPPAVHALAHAINDALGAAGQTVSYASPIVANGASQTESLRALVNGMAAGEVQMLLILGGNPVYDAPVDLNFAGALSQVGFSAHLSLYADETGELCNWSVAQAHYLETWSDIRAYDGAVTIQQPLIEPLYGGHSAHEVLDALLSETPRTGHDIVKAYWTAQRGEDGFDAFWQQSLHDGVVADSALPAQNASLSLNMDSLPAANSAGDALEINFRGDPTVWDGRFANNGWLQELPKPLTKLTWENALLISPATAAEQGLANGDLVEVRSNGHTVQAPVWLAPGHAEGAVTVHLGYGRTRAGRVGDGAGFNAYALRTADAPWFSADVALTKTGAGYRLATTQDHHSMEGRHLLRVGTQAEFAANPEFVHELDPHGEEISLYPKVEYTDNAWGMAIDLSACIGCNACTTACQAENNIPVVGKQQVLNGREMHWIRLDRYYEGDLANPATHHQPVTCMQCENAPCEVVCPVGATMHDHEGLNAMVYNRCIGTRYCSNNCPYKVRRFNFLEFNDYDSESLALQRNPNVTVRSRGVMEKCTYCVQRISAARIAAKLDERPLADGDVMTACQAACPTGAIVFGDINDPQSQAAQRKASPLNYGMLTELNTQPRTTYLARLRNPNPALE